VVQLFRNQRYQLQWQITGHGALKSAVVHTSGIPPLSPSRKIPPRSVGVETCVQRLICTEVVGGERICMGKTQGASYAIQSGPLLLDSSGGGFGMLRDEIKTGLIRS
jgi:hypothetical protein